MFVKEINVAIYGKIQKVLVIYVVFYVLNKQVTSNSKGRHDKNKQTNKKVKHFGRRATYSPYFKRTTSNTTPITNPSVFFIFNTAQFF